MTWAGLQCVIVVLPNHTHLLFVFVTCFAMQSLVSFLVLQSFVGEERAGCFTLIVFLISCGC